MSSYAIAWVVVAVSAVGGTGLVFVALRRWRRLRWLTSALVLAWALTPYRFDDEHMAPASVVALFRVLFEQNVPPNAPFALLAAVTFGVTAAYLLALAGWAMVGAAYKKSRNRRTKTR